MEYYVFVSNDCNLNCSYCSILVKSVEIGLPNKPAYTVEKLYSLIYRHQKINNDQIAHIIFFGGEPTLNMDFIEKIILFSKNHKYEFEIRFMLHTNGLLLEDLSELILQNLDAIMLSINHLKIPKFNLYEGYFKKIVDGISFIKQKKKIPLIGRFTVTENASLYTLLMQLHPFFDYLYWQIENCYQFNDYQKFYHSYKFEMNLLMNLWIDYLKQGTVLRLIPFIAIVNFINQDTYSPDFCCGYNKSMVYIQTDGNCYSCAEDFLSQKNLIGNIDHSFSFSKFNLENTICKDCVHKNICKGRCGRMHLEFSKEHLQQYCELNKIHFDFFIRNIHFVNELLDRNNISIDTSKYFFEYTEFTP